MINLLILQDRVLIGSLEHVVPIIIALIFGILLIRYAKRNLDREKQERLIHYFALFISAVVTIYHFYKISLGQYDITKDLPLYLCSLLALLIPIFTYYRKYWMFEILIFWIIAGTSQGVITPDIAVGFPVFDYFRYWVVHLGLLIIIFYFVFVFNMKPVFKSVFKSFGAIQIYVIIMMSLNYVLDANYSYLNRKPEAASVLDYLGEWPYYLIALQLLVIPLFLLIYLPFYLKRNKK